MSFKLYNQFACSSMMLPEHREALARHKKETEIMHNPPCIDEQQFALWERLVQQSYRNGEQITVKAFYENKIHDFAGVVREFIPSRKLLLLSTAAGEKRIKINSIRSIE